MSEQVHRLVYFSRNAMPGTNDEIVEGILEKTPGLFVDQDGNIYISSTTPAEE